MKNKTILQGFEWYLEANGQHWNHLHSIAKDIQALGISGVWLPPAYKGAGGKEEVGYGVYDLYDLGEFDQKGTVATKYGTKDEYLRAIQMMQEIGLEVYADIVFDHFLGADEQEEVDAVKYAPDNRNQQISGDKSILAWSKFTFPGRQGKYSDYVWNWKNFTGVDWDDRKKEHAIFNFEGKGWDQNVDDEHGNYDYLMGADLDMENPETVEQLDKWGNWYQALTQVDGYRLDAVKHIQFTFFIDWINNRRKEAGRELFVVGEYWNSELDKLINYLDSCGGVMSLFDVALHFNLQQASYSNGSFDMRNVFENTLLTSRPEWAATFVDNHDTQPGQSLQSWVDGWFKTIAYALILLHKEGTPFVFYGDLYGIPSQKINPVGVSLEKLLKVRERFAYGPQMEYFDHPNIIGLTRFGDEEYQNSGVALVVTNRDGGEKEMCVGARHAGEFFVDCLGNREERLEIREDGCASFTVNAGSASVWISEGAYQKIMQECR